jgi:hypothetical protein
MRLAKWARSAHRLGDDTDTAPPILAAIARSEQAILAQLKDLLDRRLLFGRLDQSTIVADLHPKGAVPPRKRLRLRWSDLTSRMRSRIRSALSIHGARLFPMPPPPAMR